MKSRISKAGHWQTVYIKGEMRANSRKSTQNKRWKEAAAAAARKEHGEDGGEIYKTYRQPTKLNLNCVPTLEGKKRDGERERQRERKRKRKDPRWRGRAGGPGAAPCQGRSVAAAAQQG